MSSRSPPIAATATTPTRASPKSPLATRWKTTCCVVTSPSTRWRATCKPARFIDPYGGREDLEHGLIRAVGDQPERRFDEDPLRMLRAARFAAQFNFRLEERTRPAIERQAGTLAKISRERIRDEFTKLLVAPHPALGIRLLVDLGLMPHVVPEVLELRGVSQQPGHSKDVYEHVLRVVERIPPRPGDALGCAHPRHRQAAHPQPGGRQGPFLRP